MIIKKNSVKFILLVFLAVLFLSLGKFFHIDQETCQAFFADFPPFLSWLIFIAAYVVVTFFVWLGPKDIFRIAAAFLYGAGVSTLLVWIAEMINVVVLFSFSRKLGRGYVETKLGGRIKHLDQTIAGTSFWGIFLLRLFPVVPLRFLDLGFGLSQISLKKYFSISFLGTPFRIFVVQFFLTLGVETLTKPEMLQKYLLENKPAFLIGLVYLAGSIITIFILKKKQVQR